MALAKLDRARGKLHILAGPPSTGKTTLALALAATITNAGRWPDGLRATAGDIVVWSGEDGIADTLMPRLLANGANRDRVRFVHDVKDGDGRRLFDPATDMPDLVLCLSRLPSPPVLLIVDPIVSAVSGDSHKNSETRRSLQPLVELGERIGCAILGISHYAKGTAGRDPVERVVGSIAFSALARVVLAAVKTTTDDGAPGPRLLARAKSNNGPSGGGFHYQLDQVEVSNAPRVLASRVSWGNQVEGEAHMLLAAAERADDPDERDTLDDAKSWLIATLSDAGGSMDRRELMAAAKRACFPERTVYRARHKANIDAKTAGFGPAKRSVWTLSCAADHPSPNSANPFNTANVANPETLAGMARMDDVGRNGDGESSAPDGPGEVF